VAAIVEHAGAVREVDTPIRVEGGDLAGLRRWFYGCLRRRADALFELTDALLCTPGSVVSLPELSLSAVHRRGHGAMYDALAAGQVEIGSLRCALAGLVLPRGSNGQIRLAVDVSPWPRPDAECSPDRAHCHRPCRCDGVRQTIPGWPYSMIAALESGRSSWTALLDAVRLRPGEDATEVTAAQIRELVGRLRDAGQWKDGNPPILIVMDAGYDVVRLAWLLADLPVQLVGRVRGDRVFYAAAGSYAGLGRPPRHGEPIKCDDPASWPAPEMTSADVHARYGNVAVQAWGRMHSRLTRRGGWAAHPGRLPIIEGTLIHVRVDRLPGNRAPKPVWLWHSHPNADQLDLQRVPTPLRHRAHLPVPQTNLGLDPTPATQPRAGRPVDLADHHGLHSTAAGQGHDRGPTPPLGTTPAARPGHPDPGPSRVSTHSPYRRDPGPRTETHPPRTRTSQEFPQPTPSAPLHRRQTGESGRRPNHHHPIGLKGQAERTRPPTPAQAARASRLVRSHPTLPGAHRSSSQSLSCQKSAAASCPPARDSRS
jgi:hypothetical protein